MYTELLKGKIICVIGATGKFGKLSCEGIVRNGGKLIAVVREKRKFLNIMDKKIISNSSVFECNCFDEAELNVLYKSLEKKRIDGMINCLSYRPMTKFFEDSIENWNLSVVKNSFSMFSTSRFFAQKMANGGGGSIVLISSIYGVVGPDFEIYEDEAFSTEPDYPFIKGGVVNFSRYLASYVGNKSVRVNCLVAGGLFADQSNSFVEKYSSKTLLGRMANNSDIAGPIVFLQSDLSKYMTGAILTVDGGWTAK